MRPPPKHEAKRKPFDFFAADPFDARFRDAKLAYEWTPLGSLVQCYWEMRLQLHRQCPDVLEFLDKQEM